MGVTDKYDLEKTEYSVSGWDGLFGTALEKLDYNVHTRIEGTLGETVSAYEALYLASDGKYYKAQANGAKQPVIGLAIESGILDDEIRIQRIGPMVNVSWSFSNLGSPVYLDPSTSGGITETKPDANVDVVGIVLASDSVYLWMTPFASSSVETFQRYRIPENTIVEVLSYGQYVIHKRNKLILDDGAKMMLNGGAELLFV